MKLYLSSYRIPHIEALSGLFDRSLDKLEGAILINAKDDKPAEERQQKLAALQTDLAAIGLGSTVLVDLLDHDDARRIGRQLARFDYLYAAGGNTYSLRRAMKKSGFDFAISHLLETNQVYIGESAGALVAGRSLRGFESMDDASGATAWDGLGLIDTIIVPHNDSPDPRYAGRAPEIAAANPGFEVLPLNDNQALVVDHEQRQVVTAK